MESEDSRDGGDARSSSSSSSSSSRSRHSSTSSETSKKGLKSPPRSPKSPKSRGPRSPSPDSRSQSPSAPASKPPQSPDHLSEAHSDINSPETSMPAFTDTKSPVGPKSPSDTVAFPEQQNSEPPIAGDGPKTPQSPASSVKSPPGSPDQSRPSSPVVVPSTKPNLRSRSNSHSSRSSSPSPERASLNANTKSDWSPKDKWRRHTKAEQKMVDVPSRERSRSSSSQSSQGSTYNKRRNKDTAAQDISEGEMESDQEDRKPRSRTKAASKQDSKDLNMSHEDLSDVSDLDSVGQDDADKDPKPQSRPTSPSSPSSKQSEKVNGISQDDSPKSDSGKPETPKLGKLPQEKTSTTEDGEEQLDFEAEEGECVEPKPQDQSNGDGDDKPEPGQISEETKPGQRSRGSSLEEGEVSDEAERRPEETEPRPVCRFFSRGACTWGANCRTSHGNVDVRTSRPYEDARPVCRFFTRGACARGISCRFLHPGVTDKGNYNMFDVVRGVPSSGAYPVAPARDVAPPESAWERGLRTAKEMVRIANKRKEQDMDFEEKKLHLPLGGVVHDPDLELSYVAAAVGASPPHPMDTLGHHREADVYGRSGYPPGYRGRYPTARPVPDERERYYERERPGYERERPHERPPFYDERAAPPDDLAYQKRRVRSSREVIVQRAEVERREVRDVREVRDAREMREVRDVRDMRRDVTARDGRGDEWADPWMRAEPAARRRKPQSSDDSYSSSSSNSSSRSSRSPGSRRKQRASSSSRQRLSPSVIVRERRLATARAAAMNPPAPRRRATSPSDARHLAVNPPPPVSHRHKEELDPYGRNKIPRPNRDRKKYSRSSSSGSESSSTTSESESDSHSSSTSGSSGARRARHARLLNAAARPRMNATPKPAANLVAAVTVTNKKDAVSDKEPVDRKRSASSPVDDGPAGKKAVSRREELLKQLKAVEDAIARKRSKI